MYTSSKPFVVFMLISLAILFSPGVFAKKFWAGLSDDWYVYFDNGQTYVRAVSLTEECSYQRASLANDYGDEKYRDRMFAYLLSEHAQGKAMNIVLDESKDLSKGGTGNCRFYGARAQ